MKVIPTELAQRISGRPKNGNNVWTWNEGQQLLRKFTQPTNPDSSNQQLSRANFSTITKSWSDLDESQRDDWNEWALTHPVINNLGLEVNRQGVSAYTQLTSLRYARTGSLGSGDAPTMSQPPPPTGNSFGPAGSGGNTADIVVSHGITTLTNLFIMVKLTAVIPKQSINPRPQDYRLIEGVNSGSFQPLATSPGTYNFTDTRFSYADLDLVGISVQIVTSEGYASLPLRQKHVYAV